ncbi:MAG: hypothetical protein SF123_13780 [Chloroflexota bacterium]|nr:hypothetical protein [Chloroflexota bacterium]
MPQSKDFAIPIYIDKEAMLDILASIEDGFSFVERVTTLQSSASNIEENIRSLNAELTIPQIVKIGMNPAKSEKSTKEEGRQLEADRYHTYGSLVNKMRNRLAEERVLKVLDFKTKDLSEIELSDFVEVQGLFEPNPFGEIIRRMQKLLEIVGESQHIQVPQNEAQIAELKAQKAKIKTQEQRQIIDSEIEDLVKKKDSLKNEQMSYDILRHWLKVFSSDVFQQSHRARASFVVHTTTGFQLKAVTWVYIDSLRDTSVSEISFRPYRLIGKVVNKINGPKDSFKLFAGTGLGGLSQEFIGKLFKNLEESINKDNTMQFPKLLTEISGPSLEILPIAIYV